MRDNRPYGIIQTGHDFAQRDLWAERVIHINNAKSRGRQISHVMDHRRFIQCPPIAAMNIDNDWQGGIRRRIVKSHEMMRSIGNVENTAKFRLPA